MARKRRHLTDEELEALHALATGHRPPQIGAIAALIAAIATLISAVTASILSIVDRIMR